MGANCKKLLALGMIILVVFFKLKAQGVDNSMTYNRSSNPSNNSNSALFTSSNTGVDLYTGRIQVGLPLFTLESTDLKIPIGLSYAGGSGIKIDDPNTPVGLGWLFQGGGSISRTVRGLPDESTNGYIGTNNWGLTIANEFNHPIGSSFSNSFRLSQGNAIIDAEPDIFFVQTPSFSFKFTLDENGIPVFQTPSGYKITHSLYKNTANASTSSIVVTDDRGNQFYFGTTGSSRESAVTTLFGTQFTFLSTWYLDKITTYNSKDVILFNYMLGADYSIHYDQVTKDFTSVFSSSPFPPSSPAVSVTGINVRTAMRTTITYSQPKYLAQIITRLGEADLTYTYNGNAALKAVNPPALTSISIKQLNPKTGINNIVLRTYALNYSDLETGITGWSPPLPDPVLVGEYRRLLNNITVVGNTTETASPLTLFNLKYNQSYPFPDKDLPQNCDYWGYINKTQWLPDDNNSDEFYFTSPSTNRQPYLPFASLLMLNEVDNLSGSAIHIEYELNTYYSGSSNVSVGGLRVASLSQTNPNTGENLSTLYNYLDAANHSTGQLYSDLYKKVNVYFGTACCSLATLSFPQSPYAITDDMDVLVGYSSVKVVNPNGGWEVDNFYDFADFPDIITMPSDFANDLIQVNPTWHTQIGSVISSFSYKRGLLKSKAICNSAGTKISEDVYTYGSLDAAPAKKEIGYQTMTWYLTPSIITNVAAVNIYNSNIENYRLSQLVHKDFDQINTANFIQQTTNYTYSANKRLVRTASMTDSKGSAFIKTFYYPDDLAIPMVTTAEQSAINLLKAANCINTLVHETDSRNGSIKQIHNSFSNTVGAKVFLASISNYSGTTLASQMNYNYDPTTSAVVSSNKDLGMTSSAFYGYNSSLVTATIEHASTTPSPEFFYEGFEQNASAISGNAHTGNMYLNANYTVPFVPPAGRKYVIQSWSLVGGIWKFTQQPYTTHMVVGGPVDDIRVFPDDALMTTYTYSPLVGTTSKIDPSGKSGTLEYDGLGRLSLTRDQDRNIIKQYAYQYQTLAVAALSTVHYGVFVRNNCGPASLGSTVSYEVSAGKYRSYLSQADADQKAQDDANSNGQAYANAHGTCTVGCVIGATPFSTFISSNISSSGGSATFAIVFFATNPTSANWSVMNQIGTIVGGCTPSTTRFIFITETTRTWSVSIAPGGQISIMLVSGAAPVGHVVIQLTNGTFSL
jgi:YD repeat-containing protein